VICSMSGMLFGSGGEVALSPEHAMNLHPVVTAETVEFNGFFKPDVILKPGERLHLDFSFLSGGCFGFLKFCCCPPCSKSCRTTFKNLGKQQKSTKVQIMDARKKEQQEGLSKHDFFAKYGFVLLEHQTKMTAEDWLVQSWEPVPDRKALANLEKKIEGKPSPVKDIYAQEVEPLIRELLPTSGHIELPAIALRRGPGGVNFYGAGVHQDYGLYPEDMKNTRFDKSISQEEWEQKLDADDSAGYCVINFWRPVLPMKGPVTATPLALCDPNTVGIDDIVPQDLYGFTPGGQHNMGMKFSAKHEWYYYPNMTKDEVLVFKQFQYDKDVQKPYKNIKTAFHTAFYHPDAPKDAEKRCSSEYRIGVWLKSS